MKRKWLPMTQRSNVVFFFCRFLILLSDRRTSPPRRLCWDGLRKRPTSILEFMSRTSPSHGEMVSPSMPSFTGTGQYRTSSLPVCLELLWRLSSRHNLYWAEIILKWILTSTTSLPDNLFHTSEVWWISYTDISSDQNHETYTLQYCKSIYNVKC